MRSSPGSLRALLAAAVASACGGEGSGRTGTVPEGLDAVCADPAILAQVTLAEPLDYLAFKRSTGQHPSAVGTLCGGAPDRDACVDAVRQLIPDPGWWDNSGGTRVAMIWTVGGEVGIAQDKAQVVARFGEVDAPADALVVLQTLNHDPVCESVMEQDDGSWQVVSQHWSEGSRTIALVEVTPAGDVATVEVLQSQTLPVVGRRPAGLRAADLPDGRTARQLAALAHLEAVAVVAFERLADALARHGAPLDLVRRARRSASDEERHAWVMGDLARSRGVDVPPVDVAPAGEPSLFDLALENAVEGCVRETFGAADALYRAQHAPSVALRELFAAIAADEADHALLAWDIAAWAHDRLDASERLALRSARDTAWDELAAGARRSPTEMGAVGEPGRLAAVALVDTLRQALA